MKTITNDKLPRAERIARLRAAIPLQKDLVMMVRRNVVLEEQMLIAMQNELKQLEAAESLTSP